MCQLICRFHTTRLTNEWMFIKIITSIRILGKLFPMVFDLKSKLTSGPDSSARKDDLKYHWSHPNIWNWGAIIFRISKIGCSQTREGSSWGDAKLWRALNDSRSLLELTSKLLSLGRVHRERTRHKTRDPNILVNLFRHPWNWKQVLSSRRLDTERNDTGNLLTRKFFKEFCLRFLKGIF